VTLWQFLHDATLWQWLGLIILASVIATWRPIVIKRNKETKP